MDIRAIEIRFPEGANVILGQSHFIKTVEDLYEVMVNASPSLKFGIAFSEASGPRLIRRDGNDPGLIECAVKIAGDVACGHFFAIVLKDGFPVNVLNAIKDCREVCRIYCATANPLQALVAETPKGRGVVGVVDGEPPLGVETEKDVEARKGFLRKIGYKR
ncbi:MAG: adenosine-specific kinase [Planctomycetes bacterium]|nr:adenosine-specific kinase [Planctomycetota bacterium]